MSSTSLKMKAQYHDEAFLRQGPQIEVRADCCRKRKKPSIILCSDERYRKRNTLTLTTFIKSSFVCFANLISIPYFKLCISSIHILKSFIENPWKPRLVFCHSTTLTSSCHRKERILSLRQQECCASAGELVKIFLMNLESQFYG